MTNNMAPLWMPPDFLDSLHEEQLKRHGGQPGTRDAGMLDSALARPQNLYGYGTDDIFKLAAAYAFGITKNHPYLDGNKRTAFLTCYVFLRANGHNLRADENEVVQRVLDLSSSAITEDDFAEWLRRNCEPQTF